MHELIERLRNGPYTIGPASGEMRELSQAADALEAQEARIAQLEGALHRARPIVEADWHAGMEAKDADWEGMAYAALAAIDAALQNTEAQDG
ncbi:hypothetical protein M2336_001705 [Sphingobium sp. B1D7B]|uniref:hypothetical protein n=1 Tax=Sphingobium sp. B1D7B TaxID=2940578 RepID=UPI0022244520|nr:hypothetical protein [Sphingobium sp. B1D7B]MCW2405076.1 hypothetical protein [Sphingobium sp. B1D7B]